jgi:hypothetical protein
LKHTGCRQGAVLIATNRREVQNAFMMRTYLELPTADPLHGADPR